jgi:hypothetical protein
LRLITSFHYLCFSLYYPTYVKILLSRYVYVTIL